MLPPGACRTSRASARRIVSCKGLCASSLCPQIPVVPAPSFGAFRCIEIESLSGSASFCRGATLTKSVSVNPVPGLMTVTKIPSKQGKEKTYTNTSPPPPFFKRPCNGEKKWPVPMNLPFFLYCRSIPQISFEAKKNGLR